MAQMFVPKAAKDPAHDWYVKPEIKHKARQAVVRFARKCGMKSPVHFTHGGGDIKGLDIFFNDSRFDRRPIDVSDALGLDLGFQDGKEVFVATHGARTFFEIGGHPEHIDLQFDLVNQKAILKDRNSSMVFPLQVSFYFCIEQLFRIAVDDGEPIDFIRQMLFPRFGFVTIFVGDEKVFRDGFPEPWQT